MDSQGPEDDFTKRKMNDSFPIVFVDDGIILSLSETLIF
jgi:hypothetical protein